MGEPWPREMPDGRKVLVVRVVAARLRPKNPNAASPAPNTKNLIFHRSTPRFTDHAVAKQPFHHAEARLMAMSASSPTITNLPVYNGRARR